METIEEVDAALEIFRQRTSFFLKDEVQEVLGEEWVAENPPFHDIYSLSAVIDGMLDRRSELTEGNDGKELQEGLIAQLGADLDAGGPGDGGTGGQERAEQAVS